MWIKWIGGIRFTIPLLLITVLFVAVATFLEGMSGSHQIAEGWIYHHPLFYLLLLGYFLNILFAAFSRWPFQKKHFSFLSAHLGLLLLITGVAAKGFFGLQGVMRLHEGEGSHIVLLMDQWGLFGRDGDLRFSFKIKPEQSFKERDTFFTPLEILPHGATRWEAWISKGKLIANGLPSVEIASWEKGEEPPIHDLPKFNLSVLKTEESIDTLLSWKKEKPWLVFLQNHDDVITVHYLHQEESRQKTFNPRSPGEIVLYDGGRQGYGVEMFPFSSPLFSEAVPLPLPATPEETRPILRLRAEKRGEVIEQLIPYDPNGNGLATPLFDTMVKFQPLAIKIPHHLRLFQAKTVYRPGTTIPESYEAKITVDGEPFTLKMNQVFESSKGYRFYLSNIHGAPGEVKEVHLAVNYDPAKYFLTYPGGFFIVLGAFLLLFFPKPQVK